jgi:hypothetical protein
MLASVGGYVTGMAVAYGFFILMYGIVIWLPHK